MFEKVLFPTDFSQREEILLDCIASIPDVRDVILLHVVKETRYPMGAQIVDTLAKETAENTLAEVQHYLKSLRVLLGSVPSTVLCRISKTNVLIMRHRIIETLTGTTYEKFCPMLFSRILCPTDFSRFSEHATALVSTMKGVGEVIHLHVVPEGGAGSEIKESTQTAEVRIGAVRDSFTAQGIRSRAIVTTGNPASEIVRTAEEQDVSVIWISSYGKGCLHDFLLGSTVQDVAMNSTRPVIVIRSWQ